MIKHFFAIILCVWAVNANAQSSKIQAKIDALSKDAALKHAGLGVAIVDVESGKTIASKNAQQSLLPASTLKVVTTASAIAMLGADYTFETKLEYTGKIVDGNLQGDLIIRGQGDPTLGSDRMEAATDYEEVMSTFIRTIQQQNIQCVEGQVIGDASYFASDINGKGWQWIDLGNYYASGVWGLNFHENLYYLHFAQTSKLGGQPKISLVSPEVDGLTFVNELTSAGAKTGDNAYIYGAPYTPTRVVRGTIPVGNKTFKIKGAVPDAPLWAAELLTTQLEHNGINTSQKVASNMSWDTPISNTKVLYTHRSPKLSTIVERTNMKSVNLYCESMLRTIGKHKQDVGSAEAGVEAIQAFWEDRGLSFDGVKLEDGSGLSKNNVVTASFMAKFLRKVYKDKNIYPHIKASLPIAGQSGGMKYMLRNTNGAGKVIAKTGSLSNVRAFAGYVTTKTGKTLSFSIMVNNYTCSGGQLRKKLEPLLLAMTTY